MKALDHFYEQQKEPIRSCLLSLKHILLNHDPAITEEWKYKLPFFYYKGKMLCYFWIDAQLKQPYIGIVNGNKIEHPQLIQGNRKRMKVFYVDANKDIPIKTIEKILNLAMQWQNG